MINKDNIIKLSNGLRVANFSSPHSFEFEDGSVLPAVPEDECRYLALDAIEEHLDARTIKISFTFSSIISTRIWQWKNLFTEAEVDIVIVPRPMIDAMKANGWDDERLQCSPFRTIRLVNRIKKICSIDKFCI